MTGRILRAFLIAAALLAALSAAMSVNAGFWLILGVLCGAFFAWLFGPSNESRVVTAVTGRVGDRFPARLSAVLDALPAPVALIDARANIVAVNAAASRAFPGLKRGQPLSLGLRDPNILAAVTSCLKGAAMAEAEILERVPVERSFAVTVALLDPVRIPAAAPGIEVAVVVMRETSEQRRLEMMRVDFVANASHELRTPLASVLGFIETLQGPARDDKPAQIRFLAIMAEQARRMSRLVDDLLSLSRIELKSHIAPAESVDVTSVVRQIVDSLSGLAKERGVVIDMENLPDERILVAGDRDELLRVFDNLIENAIKYGRAGGRVELEINAPADASDVTIRVKDFGPGIPEIHLPRLTERFYRVDTGASKAEGGTGLGLAIVKHIVSRHRGRLTITSKLGEGATFAVTIPRATRTVSENSK